jgi:hypothetical protein
MALLTATAKEATPPAHASMESSAGSWRYCVFRDFVISVEPIHCRRRLDVSTHVRYRGKGT